MNKKQMAVGVVVVLVIVAVGYAVSRSYRRERPALYGAPAAVQQMRTVMVALDPQNNSGEAGTATLTEVGGKVQVILKLTGAPKDVTQPAHIHTGSCAEIGGVKYPLAFPVNGESVTVLDMSLERLLGELPLAVNVHKSPQEAKIYYACGDITK